MSYATETQHAFAGYHVGVTMTEGRYVEGIMSDSHHDFKECIVLLDNNSRKEKFLNTAHILRVEKVYR